MSKEENYFVTLMKDHGFKVVNEEFVKFLNRSIKREELELFYVFDSVFPERLLKDQDLVHTVFELHGRVRVVLKGLDYEALDSSILYDEEVAVGPVFYTSIVVDCETYYPAMKRSPSLTPEKISDNVYLNDDGSLIPVFMKIKKAPLKTENILLTKENYERFNAALEFRKAKGIPAKRITFLKHFLADHGFNSFPVTKNQLELIGCPRRLDLWRSLSEEAKLKKVSPKWFPSRNRSDDALIVEFFKNNVLVSFKHSS